ncbi:MAG: crossover junction endodeoxyribonuclease RuvC [Rhodospirillaceae bacterium]|nr:crossover junction endodeoxyribonuclease RuvC [Rhodospirillaceae bacterium]
MRLIGLDPGLRCTGWGIIETDGNRLSFVAEGIVETNSKLSLSQRLAELFSGVSEVIGQFSPVEAAVEETFVNKNPASALKLGQARGVVLLAPSMAGLVVAEYSPNMVKKSVVGSGHASKEQVQMMVKTLLPKATITNADAGDALAIAICHAHLSQTNARIASADRSVIT